MEFPEDLLYTREHTWARQEEDGLVVIGVTEFVQRELGEISYVELPREGEKVSQMEVIGSVESLRGVTEIYSPLSGTVMEVNELLLDDPTVINDDPYGEGWIAVVELEDPSELDRLMDAWDYQALIERELEGFSLEDDEEE
ncbi:MAG: glycine cleavage system protein GcvH [Aquificota bacterium]|uniref:Glycine cleavage system H protein n=1 Tax=Thermosulfidibacter takaii TaxID=412593 RepID=A0A7C0Y8H6_9BACT|nr:MAG: glycine cleavage system protein GcvH [Aquificota bacterium]HDD53066.1 glycine cleavage system protein GcvH [Thermosulfidibacter takaii]